LHIEQGAFLDSEGIQIGVVEGIVGIEEWQVHVYGKANHAGTTPMKIRQDALLAAAKLIIAVNETVKSFEGNQVGTVGEILAEPGASNVVSGHVKMSIELRDLSREKTLSVFEKIKLRMKAIEKETGTRIEYKHEHTNIPAILNQDIKKNMEAAANQLGLSYKFMPSGAGHDAQDMAKITPTGMIFIPSKDGISHSPLEFSKTEDIVNGANVMFKTILAIDRK
jgi:N-carbamoyl-L-amino-acid hydrolase